MALTRRVFLHGLPATLAATLVGCGATTQASRGEAAFAELRRSVASAARGTILALMPETPQTGEVWRGLFDELRRDFTLAAVRIDGRNEAANVAEAVRRYAPSAVVLMNNPTVAAYRDYQRQVLATRATATFPPAIIVMTSFLEAQQQGLRACTGIHYEPPLVTTVTSLRKVLATPVERIGVVRRAQLRGFVEEHRRLAATEHVTVVEEEVGPSPNASELKRALRSVRSRSDALWVVNDDTLLTATLIANAWIPAVSERPWIGTVVSAPSLVAPGSGFGTFAVLPDHTALGAQAAAMILELSDNGFALPANPRAAYPVSTQSTLDLAQAQERLHLRADALAQVDRILQ